MSSYTKSTNFATKDTLPSGNPLKIVRGTEIDTEFNNIATAVDSKSDSLSPTFTGTVTVAALTATGTATFNGSAVFANNMTISGTGLRLFGDFSNATIANRTLLQTSTSNSATGVGAIPNGTGTAASFNAFNNSNPTNSSLFIFACSTSESQILASRTGSGTYQPMTFYTSDVERLRITIDNKIQSDFSNATFASRSFFQTVTANLSTNVGAIPNGTATQSAFSAFNNSSPTNSSVATLIGGASEVSVRSSRTGTGAYLPLGFYTSDLNRLNIRTDGSLWTDANTQPGFFARAWVNFNGTLSTPITPNASGNVSSVTKSATGTYVLNFTTAAPDANYAVIATCSNDGSGSNIPGSVSTNTGQTTSAVTLLVRDSSSGNVDRTLVYAAIFR